MTEDAGVAGAYRGFLFADLRGYTAFGETHGDRAAADLLDAYRVLVRDEVSRHAGAEIRTEGDSFYVVFASARDAVACGLSIINAAARYSEQHPDAPLRICRFGRSNEWGRTQVRRRFLRRRAALRSDPTAANRN